MKCLVLDYGGSAVKYGLMDDASNLTCQGDIPAPRESLEQFVEETGFTTGSKRRSTGSPSVSPALSTARRVRSSLAALI